MSTFQIAVSICLLTFFLITGCNDLTQSKNQSLNSQIVKEEQNADTSMTSKEMTQEGDNSAMTTVEIIKQESRDAEAQVNSVDVSGDSPDKVAQAEKSDSKKTDDSQATMESAAEAK